VLETVKAAIKSGADVNGSDSAGDTALHSAAALGYDAVIQCLVDHGAQPNAKNKRGLTPLGVLMTRGGRPLADAGADLNGEPSRADSHATTVALLRKLGATQ
jgi:ankyrin repeat protein